MSPKSPLAPNRPITKTSIAYFFLSESQNGFRKSQTNNQQKQKQKIN
jgi:hypothetical protein